MRRFLARELLRATLYLSLAVIISELPAAVTWPAGLAEPAAQAGSAVVITTVVMITGKLLYDTLFFDRHGRHDDRS